MKEKEIELKVTEKKNDALSDLKGIFYSEFDNDKGPQLKYAYPSDIISTEQFKLINHLVITQLKSTNRLISFEALSYRIIGCCQKIINDRYKRNTLHFNVCLVLAPTCLNQPAYEGLIRKINQSLSTLEMEYNYVTEADTLEDTLKLIFHRIKDTGRCVLSVGQFGNIYLKVTRRMESSLDIDDEEVPVLLEDRLPRVMDLTSHQIISHVDNTRHILKIASLADVDVKIVKACLQNLRYLKAVETLPAFLYSSSYLCLPKLRCLLTDRELQNTCIKHVCPHAPLSIPDLYRLYSTLTPGIRIRDVITNISSASKVDLRGLLQFGELHHLIRRLHQYPVLVSVSQAFPDVGKFLGPRLKDHVAMFDGFHSLDKISCASGIPIIDLEKYIDSDPAVCIIWR